MLVRWAYGNSIHKRAATALARTSLTASSLLATAHCGQTSIAVPKAKFVRRTLATLNPTSSNSNSTSNRKETTSSSYRPLRARPHKPTRAAQILPHHRGDHSLRTMSSVSSGKLGALRALLDEKKVDVYVVPSEDAHYSEYIAPVDARRAYLTSFTGSAGCAVITEDEARLWTDGRYFLQAEKQLSEGWTLMKSGMTGVPTWQAWLKDLPNGQKIGIDPALLPFSEYQTLSKSLSEANKSTLVPVEDNLVDAIWARQQPPRPSNEVFRLEDQYSGASLGSKLMKLREKLAETGSPGMVVSQLDDVAWMFNLREVFFAYAILTPEDCNLFINPQSLSDSVRDVLHQNGVAVLEYGQFWQSLITLGKQVKSYREQKAKDDEAKGGAGPKEVTLASGDKVVKTDKIVVGKQTSWAVVRKLEEENVEVRRSLVQAEKAKKNATEVEGFRQCNIRDGAALCRYFAWLEEALGKGEKWSEYDAARKLEDYRRQVNNFMGLSFSCISSTGSNAAVIHYEATKDDTAIIDPTQIYLCDSGGQYLDGTTDTTRTLHFGTPGKEEKLAFTRVLQGHIALDTVRFPRGTSGFVLDVIARQPLWTDGLDFRHGTGHGVGHFLNVHEGPQGIAPRLPLNEIPLTEGMVISNEPGYYADGRWGIRIENVVVVKMAQTRENFGGKGYLEFEHFTMVPMQTKLVELELLSPAERKWLNEYNAEVYEKVVPCLKQYGDDRALAWLERECKAV